MLRSFASETSAATLSTTTARSRSSSAAPPLAGNVDAIDKPGGGAIVAATLPSMPIVGDEAALLPATPAGAVLGEPETEARERAEVERPELLGERVDRAELVVDMEASELPVSELRAELEIMAGKNASDVSSNTSLLSSSAGKHASRARCCVLPDCEPTEFGARRSTSR